MQNNESIVSCYAVILKWQHILDSNNITANNDKHKGKKFSIRIKKGQMPEINQLANFDNPDDSNLRQLLT